MITKNRFPPEVSKSKSKSFLKVAIDYGTTRSAISHIAIDPSNPSNEVYNKIIGLKWTNIAGNCPPSGYPSQEKAPTSSLYCSQTNEFKGIAHFAKLEYEESLLEDPTKYKLLQRSKLSLGLPEIEGIRTVDVVADYLRECIKIWKENILEFQAYKHLPIKYCLTIPANWKYNERVIMREAARKAGMCEEDLKFVLEPEAGFYSFLEFAKGANIDLNNKVVLVLDAGGGTNDITVHKIVSSNPFKVIEMCAGKGDRLGSDQINKAILDWFKSFLKNPSNPSFDESKFCEEIEKAKCNSTTFKDKPIILQQYGLSKDDMSCPIPEKGGKSVFTIPKEKWSEHYMKSIDSIKCLISGLKKSISEEIDYIWLVGGFSNSDILVSKIKEDFEKGNTRIFKPDVPESQIARGALLYDEKTIQIRVSRSTIGIGKNVKDWVSLVKVEQPINKGLVVNHMITIPLDNQKLITTNFFESVVHSNPELVGQLIVQLPDSIKSGSMIALSVDFNQNEIMTKATLNGVTLPSQLTPITFQNLSFHIIFVVDNSISMNDTPKPPEDSYFLNKYPNRLGAVFHHCLKLIEAKQNLERKTISSTDKVSMIKFSTDAEIVFESVPILNLDIKPYLNSNWKFGGWTNFCYALQKLKELLSRTNKMDTKTLPIVFFMSDGENTDGNSPKAVSEIMNMSHTSSLLSFNTIFIGNSTSNELLKSMALQGNGIYQDTNSPNLNGLYSIFDQLASRFIEN